MLQILLVLTFFGFSAQFGSGIQGNVADQSGAVVPGTSIIVTNVDTGVGRETVSMEDGLYCVPSLSPGTYKVKASKEGFGGIEYTVVLSANEIRRVDFKLTVGDLVETTTVSVTGADSRN